MLGLIHTQVTFSQTAHVDILQVAPPSSAEGGALYALGLIPISQPSHRQRM